MTSYDIHLKKISLESLKIAIFDKNSKITAASPGDCKLMWFNKLRTTDHHNIESDITFDVMS